MRSEHTTAEAQVSPACAAHEMERDCLLGHAMPVDALVLRWRQAERERLITRRLAVPIAERITIARGITRELNSLIEVTSGTIVGGYWPVRGEISLRDWLGRIVALGGRAALPTIVGHNQPLVYREWTPRSMMRHGVSGIPEPARGAEIIPNIILAPLVGYDRNCHRLGYGGGYFDRTLAALDPRPLVVGVGHPFSAVPTIHPLAHNIPMDVVITGAGQAVWREPG